MAYPNGYEDGKRSFLSPPSPMVRPIIMNPADSSFPFASTAPTYLSGHMADVVLSEFRPTRIKPDALRCVNVLLDELLWSIIKSARSVNTERLKSDGVLRVIPASLGKEAILEAEMELREYWKTSGESRDAFRDMKESPQTFPVAQVFDVLRLKCEANSSLGQAEEEDNITVEKAEQRLYQTKDAPPIEAFAPASLYLTAILEHICGHIMSCVSRVVARDSSKTSASISDLYAALCEDQALYSTVKGMNAFNNIETQHRSTRVQRKGSLTGSLVSARSRAAAASPRPGYEPASGSPTTASHRTSGDSSGHSNNMPVLQTQFPPAPSPVRSPSDRKKVPALYPQIVSSSVSAPNGRTSHSQEHGYSQPQYQQQQSSPHKRSNSGLSDHGQRNMAHSYQNDPNLTSVDDGEGSEFEELMRTGSTMKVSLTPDRLRTFEVFAKDRNQRAANKAATSSHSLAAQYGLETGPFPAPPASGLAPSMTSTTLSSSYNGGRPGSRPSTAGRSASPANDGYMTDSAVGGRRPNSRQTSRVRLEAIPQLPSQRSVQALQLDEYGGRLTPPSSWGVSAPSQPVAAQPPRPRTVERSVPPRQPPFEGMQRKQPSYGPTNIAPLYEEDFADFADERSKPKPRSVPAAAGPREPRVSQSARDLIAFLDEGPPEEPSHLSRSTSTATGLDGPNALKKSASRGFMNSLKGFARGNDRTARDRSGSTTDEHGSLRGLVRRQKSSHALASMNTTTVNIPPPSPVKPVPPRIALDSKDSIPGIGSRYRDGSLTNSQRPTQAALQRDLPAQDTTQQQQHAVALPTPPASHESPPMRNYPGPQPTASPTPNRAAPQARRITPANTAPNSPSTGNEEYATAPYGTHTRVAMDKMAEQPMAAQNGLPNGASIAVPASAEEQLRLLQRLVQTAGNIEECRLLVDGFLMQRGLKSESPAPQPPAQPTTSAPGTPIISKPLPPEPASEDSKEKSVIDWLLSGDTEYSAAGEKVTHKLARPKSRDRTLSGGRKKSRERVRTTSQHKMLASPA